MARTGSFRLTGAVLLILFSLSAAGPAADAFFGEDKAKHFLASAFIAGTVSYIARVNPHVESGRPFVVGCSVSAGLGIAKEIFDATRPGNHFCFRDLFWNIIGVTAGAASMGALAVR